ncbi:MAG: DUF177 domain-containing protein [Chloroflexota bacterium]
MSDNHTGYITNRILKLQVGFLLSEGLVGQSRDVEFDIPVLRVADDLTLDFLRGKLHLSRSSRGILVQGTLETQVNSECKRCLEDTSVELTISIEELFVYPPEPGEPSTLTDDGILDLTPLLREEIILNTPIGNLCKPDCAGLCLTCGKNLNDGPCDCEAEDINPRFAMLKSLKDNRLNELND